MPGKTTRDETSRSQKRQTGSSFAPSQPTLQQRRGQIKDDESCSRKTVPTGAREVHARLPGPGASVFANLPEAPIVGSDMVYVLTKRAFVTVLEKSPEGPCRWRGAPTHMPPPLSPIRGLPSSRSPNLEFPMTTSIEGRRPCLNNIRSYVEPSALY